MINKSEFDVRKVYPLYHLNLSGKGKYTHTDKKNQTAPKEVGFECILYWIPAF